MNRVRIHLRAANGKEIGRTFDLDNLFSAERFKEAYNLARAAGILIGCTYLDIEDITACVIARAKQGIIG